MAIAAYPDDIESWCAEALVQAIDQGATVRLLLVTSGEHGSSDQRRHAHEVAIEREDEARKVLAVLTIAEVVFLHYPDGDVEDTHALRADLVKWIRRWQPSIVFTHDQQAARLAHKSQTPDAAVLSTGWREHSTSIGKGANLALAETFILLELD